MQFTSPLTTSPGYQRDVLLLWLVTMPRKLKSTKRKKDASDSIDVSPKKRITNGVPTSTISASSSSDNSGAAAINDINDNTKPSRLQYCFYNQPCESLAKELIGKLLVREAENGERISGVIVETEAYLGGEDKAAHSYNGKRTAKNEAMYMGPGTSYVYHIYGMYTCVNISSAGDGAAVLIRALDPHENLLMMRKNRAGKRSDQGEGLKITDLCSGPSKLTQALGITKPNGDQKDLVTCLHMWLEEGDKVIDEDIIVSSRIGVDYAKEWAKKPLRFYLHSNKSVSKRDKAAENEQKVV